MMVGEFIKVNGIDLLVLDEVDDNPFVIALGTDINTEFNEDCENPNDYRNSLIEEMAENWLVENNIPAISREIDLTTLDGCKDYGTMEVKASPLTLDEYRKYSEIIVPHIQESFWLATGWSTRSCYYSDASSVCVVGGDGDAGFNYYDGSNGLAPAFFLDAKKAGITLSDSSLKNVPTEVLVAELNRRFNNNK